MLLISEAGSIQVLPVGQLMQNIYQPRCPNYKLTGRKKSNRHVECLLVCLYSTTVLHRIQLAQTAFVVQPSQ